MAVFRIDRLSASPLSATPTRERLAAILKRRGGKRFPIAQSVRLIEIALVVAIGLLLALTFWNGLGPIDAPPAPPPRAAPADPASAGPVNPFRTASVAEAAPAEPGDEYSETTLDLKLHGTWIDGDGGVAIIGTPDGKQARFAPGETIASGVTLDRVYREQIVIARNGVRESLRLINRDGASSESGAAAPPPLPPSIEGDAGMAQIGELVLATPELDAVGNMRLILQPVDDAEAFAALGLRPGDVLVAVDNQAIGRDIATGLETLAMLGGKASVTLSIERDGVVIPVTVALPQEALVPENEEF